MAVKQRYISTAVSHKLQYTDPLSPFSKPRHGGLAARASECAHCKQNDAERRRTTQNVAERQSVRAITRHVIPIKALHPINTSRVLQRDVDICVGGICVVSPVYANLVVAGPIFLNNSAKGGDVSVGLLALLDDLTAIAKLVAASVDDAAAQAAKAGSKAVSKAAGIVIDDAAVTPRYVIGFAADRELPIIAKIALGSLRNKLLILLPGALLLNYFAPWILTPLLMLGGAYLALEGYEKVADVVRGGSKETVAETAPSDASVSRASEAMKVASAVRTDFILSAEIMAITLATVATSSVGLQAGVLAFVGIGMTVLVYGTVAVIVKADDGGAVMAQSANGATRAIGRGIVHGMPKLLALLGAVGMVAMLWVGGGIIIHGLHELGVHAPEETLQGIGATVGRAIPAAAGVVSWLVTAGISALIGLVIGAMIAPITHRIFKSSPTHVS